jgi:hypothetical protein
MKEVVAKKGVLSIKLKNLGTCLLKKRMKEVVEKNES